MIAYSFDNPSSPIYVIFEQCKRFGSSLCNSYNKAKSSSTLKLHANMLGWSTGGDQQGGDRESTYQLAMLEVEGMGPPGGHKTIVAGGGGDVHGRTLCF
jgi:hypothetical protein